jgi:YVTN family beta-propeller protein
VGALIRMYMRRWLGIMTGALALVAPAAADAARAEFAGATNSSPIVLSRNGKLLWVVNPGGDNVAVIDAKRDRVIKRIGVGDEPQGIAVDPRNRYAYVANAASGTVTVIRIRRANPRRFKAGVARNIGRDGSFRTGSEPWNIVSSRDGRRMFVANSSQDTVTVIDAMQRKIKRDRRRARIIRPHVIGSVALRGSACNPDPEMHFQPRGLAVSKDNRKLFVTGFLAFTRPGHRQVDDQGRQGIVCRIRIDTSAKRIRRYRPQTSIAILPRDTGFTVDKNLDNVPDPVVAWPNQLQSIVIRGNYAYLPNIAVSPEGPQRFNNSTMAFVNVLSGINRRRQVDGSDGRFLNLHLGARVPESGKKKLFFANPWAIAFTNHNGSGAAYVVSAASDLLVKVTVTAGGCSASPVVARPPATSISTTRRTRRRAAQNPQGIVINKRGTRAWTYNFVSRNVTKVNLRTDSVLKRSAWHPWHPRARRRRSFRSAPRCSSPRAATSSGRPGPPSPPTSASPATHGRAARAATSRASPTASCGRSAQARGSRCR